MKKIFMLFLVMVGTLLLPFMVRADEYKSLNYRETLEAEEFSEEFSDYEVNEDAITIYLFRGQGCGYCRKFLTFMNSITEEYGKYFNMVSYEVWNNEDNSNLMNEVSTFFGQEASGVPYIIIGDRVFGGYTEEWNEDIKNAIMNLYNTDVKERYDVFKEMNKRSFSKFLESISSETKIVLWNLLFVIIATVVIITYNNLKVKELKQEILEIKRVKYSLNKDKNKDRK